jgi:hypothetical protein
MRAARFMILCACVASIGPAFALEGREGNGFILAGEPVAFDEQLLPRFTSGQIALASESTRKGFAMWAATGHGRRSIARFNTREFRIVVIEDLAEYGPGRAPQPAIATLIAANDPSRQKHYELILNPDWALPRDFRARLLSAPWQSADVMAATWAAEMLHIWFYAEGISLPHHGREDFQRHWRAVAAELGYPGLAHGDPEVRPYRLSSLGR